MNQYFERLWRAALGQKAFYASDEVVLTSASNPSLYTAIKQLFTDNGLTQQTYGEFRSYELLKLDYTIASNSGNADLSGKGISSLQSTIGEKTYLPLNHMRYVKSIDLSSNDSLRSIAFSQQRGLLQHITFPTLTSLSFHSPNYLYINSPSIVEDEGTATVTRLQYSADKSEGDIQEGWEAVTDEDGNPMTGDSTIGGLPYIECQATFPDSDVTSDGITLKGVHSLSQLDIRDNHSTGVLALAAEIAEVQSQERCQPDLTGNLQQSGFSMGEDAEDTDTYLTADTEADAVSGTCDEVTDEKVAAAIKALFEGSASGLPTTAEELMSKFGVKKAWQRASGVSASSNSGITILMDGRQTMTGYGVDGASDVVWTPLPLSYLLSKANGDSNLLSLLLCVLGMPASDAKAEATLLCAEDYLGKLPVLPVTDGIYDELGTEDDPSPIPDDMKAHTLSIMYRRQTEDDTDAKPIISSSIDGTPSFYYPDNEMYVFGIFAALPKVSLGDLMGIAGVFVGVKGGVPSWMVTAMATYGVPLANLVKAFSEWSNVQYAFHANSEGKWGILDNNESSFLDVNYIPNANTVIHCKVRVTNNICWVADDRNSEGSSFVAHNETGNWLCQWGSDERTIIPISYATDAYVDIILKNKTLEIDGTVYAISVGTTFCNILIGAYKITDAYRTKIQLYQIKDNSVDICLVPFYDSSTNAYCMLDLIGYKKYFNAASSGSFTYSLE